MSPNLDFKKKNFSSLTKAEKKDREYKKNILRLAREHDRAREMENVKRYQMPDERTGKNREDFVYTEVDERERVPNAEQRKWEEEQMGFAQYHFGAKDAEKRNKRKDYEIILDSEIEFVQAMKEQREGTEEEVSKIGTP